jgi:hypothetical protein
VSPITIDKLGNLVGAPDNFREFFFRDQAELMGLG